MGTNQNERDQAFERIAQPFHKGHENLTKGLEKETDRGLALICASLLEGDLERMLLDAMVDDKDARKKMTDVPGAPLGTFYVTTLAAYSFGFISKRLFDDLNAIRTIRNAFAHAAEPRSFSQQDVRTLVGNLSYGKGNSDAREAFVAAVLAARISLFDVTNRIVPRVPRPPGFEGNTEAQLESRVAFDAGLHHEPSWYR